LLFCLIQLLQQPSEDLPEGHGLLLFCLIQLLQQPSEDLPEGHGLLLFCLIQFFNSPLKTYLKTMGYCSSAWSNFNSTPPEKLPGPISTAFLCLVQLEPQLPGPT
jgi:hypothetical protein